MCCRCTDLLQVTIKTNLLADLKHQALCRKIRRMVTCNERTDVLTYRYRCTSTAVLELLYLVLLYLASKYTCVASPTKPKRQKNITVFPKYYWNRGLVKIIPTHGVMHAIQPSFFLPAFSLLRHRGATARRPEPKRVLPWPNPKLDWRQNS